jgi:hypothetical protein
VAQLPFGCAAPYEHASIVRQRPFGDGAEETQPAIAAWATVVSHFVDD